MDSRGINKPKLPGVEVRWRGCHVVSHTSAVFWATVDQIQRQVNRLFIRYMELHDLYGRSTVLGPDGRGRGGLRAQVLCWNHCGRP